MHSFVLSTGQALQRITILITISTLFTIIGWYSLRADKQAIESPTETNTPAAPAIYYGWITPTVGFAPTATMDIFAEINGKRCGQSKVVTQGVQLAYTLRVTAESPSAPYNSCGTTALTVTFVISNWRMDHDRKWDNTKANFLSLTRTLTTPAPGSNLIMVSSINSGTVPGIAFNDEDILAFDPSTKNWSMIFDGSDIGISPDIDSFAILNDSSLLLSLDVPFTLTGLGLVDDSDIVRFVPSSLGNNTTGRFEWYFDGSDVGLADDGEDIDAVSLAPDGRLIISTLSNYTVTVTGTVTMLGEDEDLLRFTPTSLGENTLGSWDLYFDGTRVGLTATNEDVQGLWINPTNNQLYLSTSGAFSMPVTITSTNIISGDGADIFICTPQALGASTSCNFSLLWDGTPYTPSDFQIDGLYVGTLPARVTAAAGEGSNTDPDMPNEPDPDEVEESKAAIFLPLLNR